MRLLLLPKFWDRNFIALFTLLILSSQTLFAQIKMPAIRATSKKVDVKDGEVYQKSVWNLSPETKPDIYYSLEPLRAKTITFYTDIDSISFRVVPGSEYDFIIILNETDSCYTRISAAKPVSNNEAGQASSEIIEPEKLKQDFVLFRNAIQNEHPGVYRYKSKNDLDTVFDSCYATLKYPMPPLEFGKVVMFLISQLEDGHTGSNIPRLLMHHYKETKKVFPVNIHFIRDRAYVLCSRIKELPPGSEILSVNNMEVPEIRKELFRYLPSDGKIETKKNHTINSGAFSIIYDWIFGKENFYLVRYKNEKGRSKTITIEAQLIEDLDCGLTTVSNTRKDLQLDFLQNNTALLTIKTFEKSRPGSIQSFPGFLNTSFKEIRSRNISNLIIDLRGNAGGADEYGALLYSYLTNRPFNYFYSIESVTGKIQTSENHLLDIQQPQENHFNGKIFFLINGISFSTTADFCAIAKSNKRGMFIGEETGGGYYGNTSGQIISTQLPNSKIIVNIPKYKYVNDVKASDYPDRGIIPDYSIMPTISEVLLNKDVQLNFAIELTKMK